MYIFFLNVIFPIVIRLEKPKQIGASKSPQEDSGDTAEHPGSKQHKSTSTALPSIPTATLISSLDKDGHTASPPHTSGQGRVNSKYILMVFFIILLQNN